MKIKPIKRVEKSKEYLSNEEITNIRDACKYDIQMFSEFSLDNNKAYKYYKLAFGRINAGIAEVQFFS